MERMDRNMGNSIQLRHGVTCVPADWVHLPRSRGIDHAVQKTEIKLGYNKEGWIKENKLLLICDWFEEAAFKRSSLNPVTQYKKKKHFIWIYFYIPYLHTIFTYHIFLLKSFSEQRNFLWQTAI